MPCCQKYFMPFRSFSKCFRNFKHEVSLNGALPAHFLKSEWESFTTGPQVSTPYLVYRGLTMIGTVTFLMFSIFCRKSETIKFHLCFLTHWTLCVQTLYSGLLFGRVMIAWWKQWDTSSGLPDCPSLDLSGKVESTINIDPRSGQKLTGVDKCIWSLYGITLVYSLIVTVVYWTMIYPNADVKLELDSIWCGETRNLMAHGFNLLVALTELMVTAIPIKIAHFVYTLGFGSIYTTFTLIYHFTIGSYPEDNKYIYSFLDWENEPGKAGLVYIIGIPGLALAYFLVFLLYCTRLWLVWIFWKPSTYEEHFQFQVPRSVLPDENLNERLSQLVITVPGGDAKMEKLSLGPNDPSRSNRESKIKLGLEDHVD